ncbi:MAG: hypothetical protein IKS58_04630, partial [Paludibacteraceae bacterium]|nr:hypothetical protein [Paludibacteraceae bacterium]
PIPVKDRFLVAVDYSSKLIPIEVKVDGYNEPVFIPVGSQYIQCNDDPAQEIPVGIDAPNCNDFNLCIKAYTRKPTPTIATDEKASKETPAVINGRINPDIWNYAETIDIYTLDGRLVQHLTQNSLVNSKGLLIFVVRNLDGSRSSLEILK